MKAVHHFGKDRIDVREGVEFHFHVFAWFQVERLRLARGSCEEEVGFLTVACRLGVDLPEELEARCPVPGFFEKFTRCGVSWSFAGFDNACRQLKATSEPPMTVLTHHDELGVVCDAHHGCPRGALNHMVVGKNDAAPCDDFFALNAEIAAFIYLCGGSNSPGLGGHESGSFGETDLPELIVAALSPVKSSEVRPPTSAGEGRVRSQCGRDAGHRVLALRWFCLETGGSPLHLASS
jgi:hypothetical protein